MVESVTPDDLRAAMYCAAEVIRGRRRTGVTVPSWLRQLESHLALALALADTGGPENGVSACSEAMIGTGEAARILGLSPRRVREIVSDLDGRRIGRKSWAFDPNTVREYAKAKREKAPERWQT